MFRHTPPPREVREAVATPPFPLSGSEAYFFEALWVVEDPIKKGGLGALQPALAGEPGGRQTQTDDTGAPPVQWMTVGALVT